MIKDVENFFPHTCRPFVLCLRRDVLMCSLMDWITCYPSIDFLVLYVFWILILSEMISWQKFSSIQAVHSAGCALWYAIFKFGIIPLVNYSVPELLRFCLRDDYCTNISVIPLLSSSSFKVTGLQINTKKK